jgi:phage gp46-like protein
MLKLAFDKNKLEEADLVITSSGHSEADPLETAAIISLFTNRRALDADKIPVGVDRQGWWADPYRDQDDQDSSIGSRLWVLEGAPDIDATIQKAKEYCSEAFAWWLRDGVASSVSVDAKRLAPGILGISVEITKPNETSPRKLGPWRFLL